MGKVLIWNGETGKDLDADSFLETAKGKLNNVIIIGREKEGGFWMSATHARPAEIALDLQKALADIIEYSRQEDE